MIDIVALTSRVLTLGRLGENEHRRIKFPIADYASMYPGATYTLTNRPPNGATGYPVAGITHDDEYVYWVVGSSDLTDEGQGECELSVMLGETVAKSDIYATRVLRALDGSGTAPAPWVSWQQALAELAADAEAAAAHYPVIIDGYWYVWDVDAGAYANTDVSASGADGVSPAVSVAEITGGHRVTITDADGDHVFDVMDGADGQDGYSPTASVSKSGSTATITITDKNGTTTASVSDGTNGTDGTDGISPTVAVTDITGGHRITITDADGAHSFDVMDGETPTVPVQDVQVNGTSVLNNGVANVPACTTDTFGVVKPHANAFEFYNGYLRTKPAGDSDVKESSNSWKTLTPSKNNGIAFYGLAKAAGDTTQSASSNAVGAYTETARSKISDMLNAPVSVSGSTPTITAMAGVRYVCGEVSTLAVTVPASGCVDVVFESGSTPTVLTVTSAKSGVTAIKWAGGWDGTCEASTTYEINILDGEFGVVGAWT